jgi:hypothetical protein
MITFTIKVSYNVEHIILVLDDAVKIDLFLRPDLLPQERSRRARGSICGIYDEWVAPDLFRKDPQRL